MEQIQTKYKYNINIKVNFLESDIPYKSDLSVRLIRGKKNTEGKKRIKTENNSNRKYEIDETLSILSTLEYNPKIGCCEEK